MIVHFKIIGFLMIVLASIHLAFPRYFQWNKELKSLSLINRQMMIVHTFFIALAVLLIGVLCLTSGTELIETTLGKTICLGLGIFWGSRLVVQFFGYSPALWKGKIFETSMHILFSALWFYFSIVFLWVGYSAFFLRGI